MDTICEGEMDAVVGIYDTLRSQGLCEDQSDFSERWLGRSRGYLAYLRSNEVECCPVSRQLLSERLWRRAEELRHPAPTLSAISAITSLRRMQAQLEDLAGRVKN